MGREPKTAELKAPDTQPEWLHAPSRGDQLEDTVSGHSKRVKK
ncbi:MAG: hypothetical protein AB2705_06070 [Candidatus Thiodiazotropha sp.]